MSTTDPNFNPTGSSKVANIKAGVVALEEIIKINSPAGRRQALALTNLETAAMYAVKSVFDP